MKRRWNLAIWAGFMLILAAVLTYLPIFVRFPITRDFPWATLLLFGSGLALIARGLSRAYREPQRYRGRIFGSILGTLGVALFALFCVGTFYIARQIPESSGAPRVGQKAPDFTLPDVNGNLVTLSGLLGAGGGGGGAGRANGVLLVFYRGDW